RKVLVVEQVVQSADLPVYLEERTLLGALAVMPLAAILVQHSNIQTSGDRIHHHHLVVREELLQLCLQAS
ncbi:hypothetical protein, partial [Treponema pallidum]|uniref:hypothetical protein n=1 Tax=Treponema pallidum TaxID=160 RepID=UPI00249B5A59